MMPPNQIPYNQLDWLLIAIYFLAMPIVALLASTIGLVGRARRGGILWSTNVGLLGGAIVCVIWALALSTLVTGPSPGFFDSFERSFRWVTLGFAICATFGCALAAAIAWRRIHPPRELQPFAFSMRALLLVQLFTLLSMGSYLGLRLFLLTETTDQVAREFRWSAPGWSLDVRKRRASFSHQYLTPGETQEGLSNATLKELASLSKVKHVSLDWRARSVPDLSPLLQSSTIESIYFSCKSMPRSLIEELAASQIKKQSLSSDFRAMDFAPYRKSKSIRDLSLAGEISISAIESLADCDALESLSIRSFLRPKGLPVTRWPTNLKKLRLGGISSISRACDALANHPRLEDLEIMVFESPALDDQALAVFTSIPNLKRARFAIENNTNAGYESLAKLNLEHLHIRFQDREIQVDDLRSLKQLKALESLDISWSSMTDEVARELLEFKSLTELRIGTRHVSEDTILELALLPNLRVLGIPSRLNLIPTQEKVDAKRQSRKLTRLYLETISRIPSEPSPDAN